MRGHIIQWFEKSGFGFIKCDENHSDVFIHYKVVPPGVCGVEGLELEFDTTVNDRGARAVDVRVPK